MNNSDAKYKEFSLIKEMMETPEVIRRMDVDRIREIASGVDSGRFFLTGEGSSRLLPAGKARYDSLKEGYGQRIESDGALQATEYSLDGYTVFVASNSGRTREGVVLLDALEKKGHINSIGLVGNDGTPIVEKTATSFILGSGPERAVAATKTVVEQALFYDMFFRILNGRDLPDLSGLADAFGEVLAKPVGAEISDSLTGAGVLYWAGRTDGVAAELALKTNEITRKPSDFLEGTYAVHGIEEVMSPDDCVIVTRPFADEEQKMHDVLTTGVGMKVFSIRSSDSLFDGIDVPDYGPYTAYLELAAGWNLLVEIGLRLGINLDKAERARKVGNEFTG